MTGLPESRMFDTADQALALATSALQASTERAIFATDLDGLIVLWNEGARRVYGYDPAEIVGKLHADLFHTPEDILAGKNSEIWHAALVQGKWAGTLTRMRKDGSGFPSRDVVTPRRDAGGSAAGFLIISEDISHESSLTWNSRGSHPHGRSLDEKYQGLLEAAPDSMVIVDAMGVILLVNSQTEKLFGYGRDEIVGKTVECLVPARSKAQHENHRREYTSDPRVRPMGQGLALYGLRKDGTEFPVEISLSPMGAEAGMLVTAAIRDVSDRRRIEQALREKNVELENAIRAKDRFLASMSHELRTPLNAIIGFTGTLLMKLPGPLTGAQQGQLETVQSSARHLLSLINDLLDLARIESGKVQFSLEPVVCQRVIEEVATSLRPLAESKHLRLEVHAPETDLIVQTDRRALRQILINLANNAIKFTESGGVRLSLASENGGKGEPNAVIGVSDTGVGIRPEDQARLFQAFERIGTSGARKNEGTGLGLHLSGKLAEHLGGRIRVRSELGEGSTFTLVLPLGSRADSAGEQEEAIPSGE